MFLIFAAMALPAAAEPETLPLEVLDYLLRLPGPAAPQVVDNTVVFTAASSLRRVGIAFADEGFSTVHWMRPLVVNEDPMEIIRMGRRAVPHRDTGISFHVYQIPEGARSVDYRLVINGLWTADPSNPDSRRDSLWGATVSVVSLGQRQPSQDTAAQSSGEGGVSFTFTAEPGQNITVAGSFNNWDPFMYRLQEGPAGTYSARIPLSPGRYQYVFFHRGERFTDPGNNARVFSREGEAASEIVVN